MTDFERQSAHRQPRAANDNELSSDQQRSATANGASERANPARKGTASKDTGAANDDCSKTGRVAANDNDILVSDDLPRPLPIAVGEANVVRKLLGERFRQLLMRGEEAS